MARLERHIFTSDFQCPDHNEAVLKPLFSFIKDYKPDYFHIVGDFVNFTGVSKYDVDPHYNIDFVKEVELCRELLERIVRIVRLSNPRAIIDWDEGNHELRLIRYLMRDAKKIALLNLHGEEILSIPYLFDLKRLGVKYYPMTQTHKIGGMLIEHGEVVRKRAGDTAKYMLDARNISGVSGHTHRLGYTTRTTATTQWWIELGCLCNLQPTPAYIKNPDWQAGFAVGQYDQETKTMYPTIIPILNNRFTFGEKLYS